jgi:hypothetical protein
MLLLLMPTHPKSFTNQLNTSLTCFCICHLQFDQHVGRRQTHERNAALELIPQAERLMLIEMVRIRRVSMFLYVAEKADGLNKEGH